MIEENEIQYFAGGATWDNEDKTQEFLDENKWQNGYAQDTEEPSGKRSYNVINRISKGDMFALKALSGQNNIKIIAIGEVFNADQKSEGRLDINWILRDSFIIPRPIGEGSGDWQGTITQVIEKETIKKVFVMHLYGYLKSIQIENYFDLKKITLSNLESYRCIYFLGENGHGKTLLLQAVLIALKYKAIEIYDKSKIGYVSEILKKNSDFKFYASTVVEKKEEIIDIKENLKYFENIFAYGVQRRLSKVNNDEEKYGFMTLFDREESLRDPVRWLNQLLTAELYAGKNEFTFWGVNTEQATKLLSELLSDDGKLNIEVKPDRVEFIDEWGKRRNFEDLSVGYKNVMTWVCDLISRLSDNQPNVSILEDYRGIVLVDEIDLHLHPKWASKIVNKLRTWFPNIQFFFTTHSPIVILGASDDAVFYKVYKEEGVTKISEPYYSKDFSNAMANIIITSPLFDLETAAMKTNSNDVDTNDSSLHSKIYKKVSEYMEEKRKQGKKLFTESEIDQLIDEALLLSKGESA